MPSDRAFVIIGVFLLIVLAASLAFVLSLSPELSPPQQQLFNSMLTTCAAGVGALVALLK